MAFSMWSLLETFSAVVALIVAFCPPSSFSRLIAPGPNFPLVNYLRHNGHSLRRPDFAQAVVVALAAARRGRPKPKSFAPGSLRGSPSSSSAFTLTKTDHFLPPFDWPSQCTDFICGRSKIPMCNVRSDLEFPPSALCFGMPFTYPASRIV